MLVSSLLEAFLLLATAIVVSAWLLRFLSLRISSDSLLSVLHFFHRARDLAFSPPSRDDGRMVGYAEQGDSDLLTYPVRYLSERHVHSPLRMIPWDASGTLSMSNEEIVFKGSSLFGHQMDLSIHPDEALVNYQKGNLFWDGGKEWCVIESGGEKHYFTSSGNSEDQQDFRDESPASTTLIYQELTKRYIS